LQGAGGGALQPIAQAVLLESFPKAKRGAAMSVYAMGVVVAPILGPTLGGWLTDNYSWRWVFYINLPIGILAVFLCYLFLEDPPYLKNTKAGKIDFIGFGLLAIWIGCLQVFLDKGQDDDWFYSKFISALGLIALLGFIWFVIWELRVANPIVNLRVLKDRNLAIGSLLLFLVGAVLYSTTAVIPQFLQTLLAYPSLQSGMVLSPRGIGAIIGSIVAGRVIANSKIDGRYWIAGGFVILGITMGVFGNVSLNIAPENLIPAIILSGFGITSIFVPMTTFSMATVSRESMGDATGITSLLRNLGGSVGISLITAFITRGSQTYQALMVGRLSPFNPIFNDKLAAVQKSLGNQSGTANAHDQGYALMYQTLQSQAGLWSYVVQFRLLLIVCFACVPLVFLFKKGSKPLPADLPAAH
jgi:DHA2 family multidrug resistance protein